MLRKRRVVPLDHKPFATLPVQFIETRDATVRAAVHVTAPLTRGKIPLVCIAGLQRNMSDFSDFVAYFRRLGTGNWPVVLIDLPGRGRADDRVPDRQPDRRGGIWPAHAQAYRGRAAGADARKALVVSGPSTVILSLSKDERSGHAPAGPEHGPA